MTMHLIFSFVCFLSVKGEFEALSKRTTLVAQDIISEISKDSKDDFQELGNKIKDHSEEGLNHIFGTDYEKSNLDLGYDTNTMNSCVNKEYNEFVYDKTFLGLYENTCGKLDLIWKLVDIKWADTLENLFLYRNVSYFGDHNKLKYLFDSNFTRILDIINPWYEQSLRNDVDYLAVKDDISMHFISWMIKKKLLNLSPKNICEKLEIELTTEDMRSTVVDCVMREATYGMLQIESNNVGRKKVNCSDLNPKFYGADVSFEISILFYYSFGEGYGASLDGTIHNYKVKRIGGSLLLGAGVYIEILYFKNVANLYNQTNLYVALDLEYFLLLGASMLLPVNDDGVNLLKGPSGFSGRIGVGFSPFYASLDFAKATQTKIRQGGFNATKWCKQFESRTGSPTMTRKPTRSPRPTRPPHKAIFPTFSPTRSS